MISSLLYSIITVSADEKLPFPTKMMHGAAYQIRYEPKSFEKLGNQPFEASMSFRKPDGTSFFLQVFWTKDAGQAKYLPLPLGSEAGEKFRLSRFSGRHQKKLTPSGLPPKFAGYTTTKEQISLYLDSDWASVECQWSPHLVDNGTRYWDPAPFDTEVKSAFVEKIARHTLIRAAGLRLDPAETNSAKCRLTQAKFTDLEIWAELNAWKIGEENEYGIITLKNGEVEAVLPLGAGQIKVNGVWKEMGDSAAFFNGKLYLPAAGLEHLRGAS